jgi:hypothetical protein
VTDYQELRVRFEPDDDVEGSYRVHASGPAGEATGTFTPHYSPMELENLVLRLSRPRGVRRVESPDLELIRDFGGSLFNSVFSGRVRDVYLSSLASAKSAGHGMRISLALTETPELMPVPWEYLYDDPAFLSISMWTPVVRYLDLTTGRRPLKVEPPLRIVAMVSSPSDLPALDVAQERTKLEESLAELSARGAVTIDWLEAANLKALQRQLRHADYHVFHFIGHGGYDQARDDGVLALEDATGRSQLVSGMELGTILADETTLRLAVLNACEGARTSVDDPFSGVATSLVQREIPAVVAMQLEITDDAAITFASELYAALADGYAIDAALGEARKAIFAAPNPVEWATPVLFMRVPDGRIFDVAEPIGAHRPVDEPEVTILTADHELPALEPEVVRAAEPVEPDRAPVMHPRLARRLVAGLAACIAVLTVAIAYPWDNHMQLGRSFVTPYFGAGGSLPNARGGFFAALSPIAIVALTALGVALVARGRRLPLAAGLIVACGVAGSAKYLGVLARTFDNNESRLDSPVFFGLAVVASFALVLAGIQIAQVACVHLGRGEAIGWTGLERGLVALSGLLVLVACVVPYNSATGNTVVGYERSLALDPLAVGLALLVAAACLRYLPRVFAAGILIVLGAESLTLWLRYIGVPAMLDSSTGAVGLGGFIGLTGAVLALGVGIRVAATRAEPAPDAVPSFVS